MGFRRRPPPPGGGRRSPSETHRRACAFGAASLDWNGRTCKQTTKKCHPSASTNSQVNEFGSYTWVGDRPSWPESAAFLYSTWASKMASTPGCRSKLDAAKASMERLESLRFFPALSSDYLERPLLRCPLLELWRAGQIPQPTYLALPCQ